MTDHRALFLSICRSHRDYWSSLAHAYSHHRTHLLTRQASKQPSLSSSPISTSPYTHAPSRQTSIVRLKKTKQLKIRHGVDSFAESHPQSLDHSNMGTAIIGTYVGLQHPSLSSSHFRLFLSPLHQAHPSSSLESRLLQ